MLLAQIIHEISRSPLPLANSTLVLTLLSQARESADTTGVNDAMYAIARLIAGFIGGSLAVVLVVEGYQYLFSDSASRGMHLKRALAAIIGGAILVILGVSIAPLITTAITGK